MTTTTDSLARHATYDDHATVAGEGTDHRPGHDLGAYHVGPAGPVQTSPQATDQLTPITPAPAGTKPASGQCSPDDQSCNAAGFNTTDSLSPSDAQATPAVGSDPLDDHSLDAPHTGAVVESETEDGSATTRTRLLTGGRTSLADPLLDLAADTLDDLERTWLANANRLRQLTRTVADSDGEERGFGYDETHPEVAALAAVVESLDRLVKDASRNLERKLRAHQLWPWVKAQKGVGPKQAARLLAAIGDPYWHSAEDRPRSPSELRQYCGHGDPARSRRRKGERVEYSPTAKMRVHLIAESCVKAGVRKLPDAPDRFTPETRKAVAHYGQVYHDRRTATWQREDWTDGHKQNDALRVVGKEFLLDLWREAKRIHEAA